MALTKKAKVDVFTFEGGEEWSINDPRLKPDPRNPNVGDLDSIMESLDENGCYRQLVWNSRNGYLAAGHHTWVAMRRRGWTKVRVQVSDMDEATHLRVMSADNATNRNGQDDGRAVAALMKELQQIAGSTRGTGYNDDEVREVLAHADRSMEQAKAVLKQMDTAKTVASAAKAATEAIEATKTTAAPKQSAGPGIEDMDDDVAAGAYTLRRDLTFDHVGTYEWPRILPEQIATFAELPPNLKAWSGSATANWPDPDQHWLYNWGIDSTSGMTDKSKAIVAFYAYDQYFENWWHFPHRHVAKVLNSQIELIVGPDYSFATPGVDSKSLTIWNTFRNRWLTRYFQEAGLKVIPNVNWVVEDEAFLVEHLLPTLPTEPNTIALQLQAAHSESRDKAKVAAEEAVLARQLQLIFDTLKPKGALIYYGKAGRTLFEDHVTPGCPILWVEARVNALSSRAKIRKKKDTI